MLEAAFIISIQHDSEVPKYQQLVNIINDSIANNQMVVGDALPSVNSVCKAHKLSRDTVFKAYSILKDQGVVDAIPTKGYYVANPIRKVLLVLDTFKAYKEVLYHSFINNLPDQIITDVQFHHYNIENFKNILNNSKGKYYKYVVMNFDHPEIAATVAEIENDKLLLIDWDIYATDKHNYVCQDFGMAFFEALSDGVELLKKYREINFLYPSFTNHPKETLTYFKKFCKKNKLPYTITTNAKGFQVQKEVAYISVSDRMLGTFLEQCRATQFEPGVDVGFLSYNETPMKKFIYKGISVISTDFKTLGTKAAEFITNDTPMQQYIPTKLIVRESL